MAVKLLLPDRSRYAAVWCTVLKGCGLIGCLLEPCQAAPSHSHSVVKVYWDLAYAMKPQNIGGNKFNGYYNEGKVTVGEGTFSVMQCERQNLH